MYARNAGVVARRGTYTVSAGRQRFRDALGDLANVPSGVLSFYASNAYQNWVRDVMKRGGTVHTAPGGDPFSPWAVVKGAREELPWSVQLVAWNYKLGVPLDALVGRANTGGSTVRETTVAVASSVPNAVRETGDTVKYLAIGAAVLGVAVLLRK